MTRCHAGTVVTTRSDVNKRIAFIGQPNTGKSTFFNRITNANAGVANWPGLTVDLARAVIELEHEPVEFVDLPGIYDLNGFTLDGRSFVLQMMGFGCNVPAIMGTRVMRSRAMRLLAMLVIPFSLCSARLQVFVFILAAVMPGTSGAIALFLLYLTSFATAFIVAAILSRNPYFQNRDPFVLELPPYRFPTLKQVWLRVWGEMKEFVTRLSIFMVIGTTVVWFLTSFPSGTTGLDTYAGQIGKLFHPLIDLLHK